MYGTTFGGGCGQGDEGEGCGTVFKITPGGKQELLYVFCSQGGDQCTDGLFPAAGLTQGTDGKLYGTTEYGGAYDGGTFFSITPSGKLTTLYSFCQQEDCPDGGGPTDVFVEGPDRSFYGATGGGTYGEGTVFKISSSGELTSLYSFCAQGGQCPDGIGPNGLVLGTDGKFYGTTTAGGANRGGTVFSITASGTLTTLYSFCSQGGHECTDGYYPKAPLVEGSDGNFYGTTYYGGNPGGGTIFKITSGGNFTVLYNFCSKGGDPCPDGELPVAGMVRGTDGNFYGTTESGGNNDGGCGPGCGTIFRITPGGALTTLYEFCSQSGCPDGSLPVAGLVQDTNGIFYGTSLGGPDYGVVFSTFMGLGPFVETNPSAARVGKKVGILGTNLTGATGVTFNGVAASFEVKSPTLIVAEVPSGATSGKVQVQTPNATLNSNVPFIVLR